MINLPIELYTDGSSLGNPGNSGLGFIIRYWTTTKEDEMPEVQEVTGTQGFTLSTNNRMEIMASIYGVNKIIELINDKTIKNNLILLTSDSSYFCDTINKRWIDKWIKNGWKTANNFPVSNQDLWEIVIELINKLQSMNIILTITHVLGHNGNEFNEKADKLAVNASKDTNNHIIDTVYENSKKGKRFKGGI